MAFSCSFQTSATSGSDASSYTFSSLSFGAAAAARYIVVGIAARATGSQTISSVTIGGVPATQVAIQQGSESGNQTTAAMYIAAVPTGTTGAVVVTFSGAMIRCGVSVYRLEDPASATPYSTDTGGTTGSGGNSGSALDIPAGGVAIAHAYISFASGNQRQSSASLAVEAAETGYSWSWLKASGEIAWNGLDEDVDELLEGGGSNNNSQTVVASWGPRRVVEAQPGSFALTGQDVGLEKGYRAFADAGSFSLAGQDVTLTYVPVASPVMEAEPGAFSLTGQSINLLRGYRTGAELGSFAFAGQDVAFRRTYVLAANPGAFSLAGQDVGFIRDLLFPVDAGAFSLTGQNVTLARGISGPSGAGAFALTGQAVDVLRGYLVAAEAGGFTLTGQDVDLRATEILRADAGAFALTGRDVGVLRGYPLTVEPGAFVLTGQDIALRRGVGLIADGTAFVLTGQDVAFVRGLMLAAGAGAFALTGAVVILDRAIGTAQVLFTGGVDLGLGDAALAAHPSRGLITSGVEPVSVVTGPHPSRSRITRTGTVITKNQQVFH